jgi:Zn2+/Cd2+-exporting ATPase
MVYLTGMGVLLCLPGNQAARDGWGPPRLLLTGDREAVAQRMASYLEIPEVRAQALPEQKLDCVLEEVRQGFRPLVVGDGINDALALKAGAVGIAIGASGADIAAASADLSC